MNTPKQPTSIRLSKEARELLRALSGKLSISQAAVMEIAIRLYATGVLEYTESRKQDEKGKL